MLQENSDIGRDKSDADAEKLRFKVCANVYNFGVNSVSNVIEFNLLIADGA